MIGKYAFRYEKRKQQYYAILSKKRYEVGFNKRFQKKYEAISNA